MAESPAFPSAVTVEPSGFDKLSTREEEVLSMAASGYLDKQIGVELGVSLNTLRTYWSRIRSKVGEAPRTAIAAAYVERALTESKEPEASEEFWDWEIDLVTRTFKRLSSRHILSEVPPGEEVPLDRIFAMFHPEDAPRMRRLIDELHLSGIQAFHYVARFITGEGMVLGSAFVHVDRDENGLPLRLYGRRVPSLDLRNPDVSSVTVGFWSLDIQTQEVWANDACRKMFKVPVDQRMTMEHLLCRVHPEYFEQARSCVQDVLHFGVEKKRSTYKLLFEDGATHWCACDVDVVKDEHGSAKAVATVMMFD